jgi:hypothetical protein
MPWEHHNQVIVESYAARRPGGKMGVRIRPIAGQGHPPNRKVQWSRSLRDMHPIGTKLKIWVKLSNLGGGTPFFQSP